MMTGYDAKLFVHEVDTKTLILSLAERVYAQSECLSRVAEKQGEKNVSKSPTIAGVGPDAESITNANGGKQSRTHYAPSCLPAAEVLDIAKVLHEGREKYGKDNWKFIGVDDHFDHLLTHLLAWSAGDTSDDHLSHAGCRLLFLMHTVKNGVAVKDELTTHNGTDNDGPTGNNGPCGGARGVVDLCDVIRADVRRWVHTNETTEQLEQTIQKSVRRFLFGDNQ